jgi:hypothetical protein
MGTGGNRMTELSESMHRLTEPWTLVGTVDGIQIRSDFKPLIDMLTDRIVPNASGGIGGGLASTRSVLDVNSLDTLMHIQDVTQSWLNEWRAPRSKDTKSDLQLFWNRLHLRHNIGEVDDATFERLAAYPDTWATRIWDLVDPPLTRPLRNMPCPKCDHAKFINSNGDHVDNLIIRWRPGQEVTAECQWTSCGAVWIGRQGLILLARATGIVMKLDELFPNDAETVNDGV